MSGRKECEREGKESRLGWFRCFCVGDILWVVVLIFCFGDEGSSTTRRTNERIWLTDVVYPHGDDDDM